MNKPSSMPAVLINSNWDIALIVTSYLTMFLLSCILNQ